MKHSKRITALAASIGVLALAGCASGGSPDSGANGGPAAIEDVTIIVPADPGGGWDQTGRAMAEVLTGDEIVASAPVTNIGGAGGTVGLASLANETDPGTLMVMGLVMVGAVETNAAANRLEDTTPIARLTEEPLIIVVPADSPYEDLGDLVDDIVANGQDVTVTGGSAGGADHILAGLVLADAGLSGEELRNSLNYIPNAGGGEAVSLILGNNVAAGISGIAEFAEHVESGDMRALAVSSEEAVERFPDVPTIVDSGYDVTLTNWRGVIAPGNIDDAQREELIRVVTEMHGSDAWQEVLSTRGWADAFLPGDEFDTFLEGNITEVTQTLKDIGLVQ